MDFLALVPWLAEAAFQEGCGALGGFSNEEIISCNTFKITPQEGGNYEYSVESTFVSALPVSNSAGRPWKSLS
jgi:hypothetical protein